MSVGHAMRAILVSALMVASMPAAAQVKTLRMPAYASPGQLWVDAKGEVQGVRVKVLKELNARLAKDKLELKYVLPEGGQLTIKQAMQDVLDGKYEAYFGLIFSKAREEDGFVFGKEEIFSIPTVVWMRNDAKFAYAGPASLKGKKVGLVEGYPFLDDVKEPGIQVDRTAPNDEANVQKLLAGKVDALIDNLPRTGSAVLKLRATDKITYAKEPFDVSRFLVAYNKKVPPETVARIDAALKEMRESGTIKKILDEAVYGPLKK